MRQIHAKVTKEIKKTFVFRERNAFDQDRPATTTVRANIESGLLRAAQSPVPPRRFPQTAPAERPAKGESEMSKTSAQLLSQQCILQRNCILCADAHLGEQLRQIRRHLP